MTEREGFEAEETKRKLLAARPVCEVCGVRPSEQLAHRIPQAKGNLKRFGQTIIHHPLNLVWVCGLRCNAAVNIEHRPEEKRRLLAEIATTPIDSRYRIR